MRRMLVSLGLVAAAVTASAQGPVSTRALELRPFAGAFVPTGALTDAVKSAPMFGGQLAYEVAPNVHFLGSLAWTPGKVKFAVADDKVNVFQYDVGMEYGLVRPMPSNWLFKPFLGLGAGLRTYNYGSASLHDRTCTAGYGALGTEFQVNRVALRLEGRDYVHCYKSPLGNGSKTRNDVGLSFGVAYHFR